MALDRSVRSAISFGRHQSLFLQEYCSMLTNCLILQPEGLEREANPPLSIQRADQLVGELKPSIPAQQSLCPHVANQCSQGAQSQKQSCVPEKVKGLKRKWSGSQSFQDPPPDVSTQDGRHSSMDGKHSAITVSKYIAFKQSNQY